MFLQYNQFVVCLFNFWQGCPKIFCWLRNNLLKYGIVQHGTNNALQHLQYWFGKYSALPYTGQAFRIIQMDRKGQICPTYSKMSKKIQTSAKSSFFSLHFLIFGQVQELSHSCFEKCIIFLAEIPCFRFGRADLPFSCQDRVKIQCSIVQYILILFCLVHYRKSSVHCTV